MKDEARGTNAPLPRPSAWVILRSVLRRPELQLPPWRFLDRGLLSAGCFPLPDFLPVSYSVCRDPLPNELVALESQGLFLGEPKVAHCI